MNSSLETRTIDVSVVIGFKDWGIERLLLSVSSLVASFGELRGEVIVSDYGSTDCHGVREKVEDLGAKYVFTHTDGIWSRSRALNAGFAVSSGSVLVSTDADMLFKPLSMEIVGRRVLDDPNEALVLQCRDLPSTYGHEGVVAGGMDWPAFESSCTFRPRWGMGGMMAVSRDAFLDIRGFDERMEIYGGEDMDFAQRVRRSGRRLSWIEHPDVRMYHMWHPSTRAETDKSPEGAAAIAFNRDIVLNDSSYIRNVTKWAHRPNDAKLLASVVITTKNRAEYIRECLNSVLAQTARDIEIIVVDDGSEDETSAVVQRFTDPRVRFYKRDSAGIAASRNFAAAISRGVFTVIHDDDDLMFPDRIENHFKALRGGDSGTYGGWIDFSNSDGGRVTSNPGKVFSYENLLYNGRIFAHATLMLETRLIRLVGYDEKLRSGSDFNLAIRLGRHGVSLNHTDSFHLVRRIHDKQVTSVDSSRQKSSARMTLASVLSTIPAGRQNALRKELRNLPDHAKLALQDPALVVKPYLPDHLVIRDVAFDADQENLLPSALRSSDRLHVTRVIDHLAGDADSGAATLNAATWSDMAELRTAGIDFEVVSSRYPAEGEADAPVALRPFDDIVGSAVSATEAAVHMVITSANTALIPVDAPLLVHKTIQEHGKSTSVQIHGLSEDFEASLLLQDKNLAIEFHQINVFPGSAEHWKVLEGITK
jgi:glycosyltransferase involved in cell wall biosynthesis